MPLLFLLALLAAACGDNLEPDDGVESLSISQRSATISVGMTLTVRLDARFDDGTTRNVSNEAVWTTSNAAVASVNGPAIRAESVGEATITARFGDQTATVAITVSAAALTAIQVTPGNAVTAIGIRQQFVATGIFADGTNRDITSQVTWAATPGTVATINPAGLVTPVTIGEVTVTASSLGITGTTTLRITAATLVSIQVSPGSPVTIADGTSVQLTATGVFSDARTQNLTAQVTWTSSNAAVATVTDEATGSNGLVAAVTPGLVTITASLGTVSPIVGTVMVEVTDADLVSIAIDPAAVTLPDGATQQLTATGTFTDGPPQDVTSTVTWSSSADTIATVSPTGLVTAVAVGEATITATQGSASRTVPVTVTAAELLRVEISPAALELPQGAQERVTATAIWSDGPRDLDTEVTWTSSNELIATISNLDGERGLIRAIATGETTIRVAYAIDGELFEDTLVLTVTEAVLDRIEISAPAVSLAAGTTLELTATGIFTDDSTRDVTDLVVWTSSADATATVSNAPGEQGLLRGLVIGNVTITATTPGQGGVDETDTIDIEVTAANLVSIAVDPATASIADGTVQQFRLVGTFTDGTTQTLDGVTWSSGTEAVAIVGNGDDDRGLATALIPGETVITATREGQTATAALTVTNAVIESLAIEPADFAIVVGLNRQLIARATFDDATTQDISRLVTWSSSDDAIASVSNGAADRGRLTAHAVGGPVTITAVFGDDVETATATVTVSAATLQSIAVTAAGAITSLPLGLTVQLTATGTYDNGTTEDLTDEVVWASSNANITVSNADASKGEALAVIIGASDLRATLGAIVSPPLTLQATQALIEDFTLAAFATTVAVGEPLLVVATGDLSNNTTPTINERLTWTSSAPLIAAVSDLAGSKGLVTAVAVGGPVTITATDGTITKTFEITSVTAARAKLIINEVDYDMPGSSEMPDSMEFVEIVNVGGLEASLTGVKLALINGEASGGTPRSYDNVYDLSSFTSLAPGQTLVLGSTALLATLPPEVPGGIKRLPFDNTPTEQTNRLQNGGRDGVILLSSEGMTCTRLDSLSYEGVIAGAVIDGCTGTFDLVEGTAASAADAASNSSLSRTFRVDTDNAVADWSLLAVPTPGL